MRAAILLGFIILSESNGFSTSDAVSNFIAIAAGILMFMDVIEFFHNINK